MIARVVAVSLLLVACEGVGRPIVGVRPDDPDGGPPSSCELVPQCRAVREAPPNAFEPWRAGPRADCDADGVDDAYDDCPGVPDPVQDPSVCAEARADCARLLRGEGSFVGADLRGCVGEVPLSVGRSFARARLTCSRLRFVAPSDAPVEEWGPLEIASFEEAFADDADLEVHGVVRVVADGVVLRRARLRLTGGAILEAPEATLRESAIELVPSVEVGQRDPGPHLDLRRAVIFDSTIVEAPSERPGVVLLEDAELSGSLVAAPSVDAIAATVEESRIDAARLLALGGTFHHATMRLGYGAFASAELSDVVFAGCAELRFDGSQLHYVDVPACPAGGLRVVESVVWDSRFVDGLRAEGGEIHTSVLGAPGAVLATDGTELDLTRFCDPAAGAFRGATLRCLACGDEDFSRGEAVCVEDVRLVERGCPPIELARQCDVDARDLAEGATGP